VGVLWREVGWDQTGACTMWRCHCDIARLDVEHYGCAGIQNSAPLSTHEHNRCIYTPTPREIIAGPFVCVCAVGGCYRRCGELFVSIDWGRGQYGTVRQAAPAS